MLVEQIFQHVQPEIWKKNPNWLTLNFYACYPNIRISLGPSGSHLPFHKHCAKRFKSVICEEGNPFEVGPNLQ